MSDFENAVKITKASKAAGVADIYDRGVGARKQSCGVVEAQGVDIVGECDAAMLFDTSRKVLACLAR